MHGPSRTFDASRFAWTDDAWRGPRSGAGVLGSVVYELHVGTFTAEGTLDAAVARLDHLVGLGVDVVELMPVAAFPGRWGWGYDGVGLYAVHDGYGGPAALQRFVDACHARGLGVALDVVHNHLGASGNYLERFGPYFTEAHHTPWGAAVNLDDVGAGEVRRFLVDSALRWFRDFHVDALRLDAVHELKDDSPHHYLAELSDAVARLADELGRPLDLVAESDLNDTVMVTPTALGGRGMTAQWDDDVHHALHVALTGETHGYYADFVGGGARAEAGPLGVRRQGADPRLPPRRHDVDLPVPALGRPGRRRPARRAAAARLPPDARPGRQPDAGRPHLRGHRAGAPGRGGRAVPPRPDHAHGVHGRGVGGVDAVAVLHELRGGLARRRRASRPAAEFGGHGWSGDEVPDPQDPATRDRSVLDWAEPRREPHARMLRWYSACTALRRDLVPDGATRFADVAVSHDEDARWLVMTRTPADGPAFAVVVNLADRGAGRPPR